MAQKKRTPPARPPEVEQKPYVPWRPQKRDKNHNPNSKRKLPFHDPSAIAAELPEPSDADLVKVLAEMGPEFALGDEKRRLLLGSVSGWVMIVTHVLRHMNDRPPGSELDERLVAIESAADRLYQLFEVGKDVEEAFEHGVLPTEINQILHFPLIAATRQSSNLTDADEVTVQPDYGLIPCAVTGVAALAVLAKRARSILPPKSERRSPSEVHAGMFAVLYRETFDSEPARANGSPWVKFLSWGRKLSGLPHLSDDRLRRLPTTPKTPAA